MSGGPARAAHHVPQGPRDASMRLLTDVMDRPLDPGYELAARRRCAAAA